jgi:hypothetical protein
MLRQREEGLEGDVRRGKAGSCHPKSERARREMRRGALDEPPTGVVVFLSYRLLPLPSLVLSVAFFCPKLSLSLCVSLFSSLLGLRACELGNGDVGLFLQEMSPSCT